MEILGFLFIISLMLNLFLSIQRNNLWNENKWIKEDREKLKNAYIEICDKFYESYTYIEGDYIIYDTELKDNIKTLDEN